MLRRAGVRQQPWTLAASLNPPIADSEPLFVAGTSSRVVNSHTWWALRLSRLASCRPGWLPWSGPGQVGGDPDRHPLVEAAPQPGEQAGVGGGLVVDAGGVDLVNEVATVGEAPAVQWGRHAKSPGRRVR